MGCFCVCACEHVGQRKELLKVCVCVCKSVLWWMIAEHSCFYYQDDPTLSLLPPILFILPSPSSLWYEYTLESPWHYTVWWRSRWVFPCTAIFVWPSSPLRLWQTQTGSTSAPFSLYLFGKTVKKEKLHANMLSDWHYLTFLLNECIIHKVLLILILVFSMQLLKLSFVFGYL